MGAGYMYRQPERSASGLEATSFLVARVAKRETAWPKRRNSLISRVMNVLDRAVKSVVM